MTPDCVPLGGIATIHVQSVPKSYLGYVAMYAGEKSGAQPPFGYGYGGNDKGQTDYAGNWSGSWTVRADAPVGRGRVVIVVGAYGRDEKADTPLTVGVKGADGDCKA